MVNFSLGITDSYQLHGDWKKCTDNIISSKLLSMRSVLQYWYYISSLLLADRLTPKHYWDVPEKIQTLPTSPRTSAWYFDANIPPSPPDIHTIFKPEMPSSPPPPPRTSAMLNTGKIGNLFHVIKTKNQNAWKHSLKWLDRVAQRMDLNFSCLQISRSYFIFLNINTNHY